MYTVSIGSNAAILRTIFSLFQKQWKENAFKVLKNEDFSYWVLFEVFIEFCLYRELQFKEEENALTEIYGAITERLKELCSNYRNKKTMQQGETFEFFKRVYAGVRMPDNILLTRMNEIRAKEQVKRVKANAVQVLEVLPIELTEGLAKLELNERAGITQQAKDIFAAVYINGERMVPTAQSAGLNTLDCIKEYERVETYIANCLRGLGVVNEKKV